MTAEVQLAVQMTDTSQIHCSQNLHSPLDRADSSTPPTVITVRMIMQGKEVGMIIGKKGDNVKRYREESGAKINISDASCPERIVTVTGTADQLNKAFDLICTKFEEIREMNAQNGSGNVILPPMSFKLVIPASQCGSLIGKGGNKIKEIRETSGASVQVATDMLPGSTERAVTVSGSSVAITRCLQEICSVMLESPPKGATIPYRPKTAIQAPLMYAAAVGAAAQAGYTLPPHLHPMAAVNMQQQTAAGHVLHHQPPVATSQPTIMSSEQQRQSQLSPMVSTAVASASPYPHPSQLAQLQASHQGTPLILPQPTATMSSNQIPYGCLINPAAALGMVTGMGAMGAYLNRPFSGSYLAAAAQQQTQSTEMVIPNELIGCVIGRGGAKINEIRQLSGAQIKISNCEEGNSDRKVTITGFPETISMAAYLINTSIELHKSQLLNTDANALSSTVASQQPSLQASMAATTILPSAISPSYTKPLSVYPYNTGVYGLGPNPIAGLAGFATAAYDPKALLNASKLKMLPTNGMIKQDHRFAPY